jgi:polysaccharide deacetylase family protein (PEP-CTERM system associated)
MSVDVEDYFHVAAFRSCISRSSWEQMPSRVEQNTAKVLGLFEDLGLKATFFVLGWVAEKFPALVRRIANAGHELGCHSYSHQLIYEIDPDAFRKDTSQALDAIQQACGKRVTLYRAPSFSITRRSVWAIEILIEAGFTHDSSIFPIRHDLYGMPGAPHSPFVLRVAGGQIIEFPPPTVHFFRLSLPASGGGYLRILPLAYQKKAFRDLENVGQPGMVYFHPWELDPDQPRIKAPLRSRLRHYTGLSRTDRRIRSLCAKFRFAPMTKALPAQLPAFNCNNNGEFSRISADSVAATQATSVHGGTSLASR